MVPSLKIIISNIKYLYRYMLFTACAYGIEFFRNGATWNFFFILLFNSNNIIYNKFKRQRGYGSN